MTFTKRPKTEPVTPPPPARGAGRTVRDRALHRAVREPATASSAPVPASVQDVGDLEYAIAHCIAQAAEDVAENADVVELLESAVDGDVTPAHFYQATRDLAWQLGFVVRGRANADVAGVGRAVRGTLGDES